MSMMKFEEAKKAFELGAVKKAMVVEAWGGKGWNLLLKVDRCEMMVLIITQRGEDKVFKTLDAAGNEVARIGLASFEVHRKKTA